MKQMFRDFITPQRFLALNYGNFLFDFYSPSIEKPDEKILEDWVKTHFKLSIETGEHKESFIRFYKAYHSFLDSFDEKQIYKEYRQYAPLFSQPLLVSSAGGFPNENGILFIYDMVKNEIRDQHVFAGDGDYEGIAQVGEALYIMRSDAAIFDSPTMAPGKKLVLSVLST
jgi:hypothetical protein